MTTPVLLPIHMVLLKSLMNEYGRASGARLNTTKSKGLWLGRWRSRTDSPCGLTWVNTSLKIVGIYTLVPKMQRSNHGKRLRPNSREF